MRWLLGLLAVLAVAGCGRTTAVREPDIVVRGDQAITSRPSPDEGARGLRITSTRIAVVTHGQASDPIWAIVRKGVEDAGRENNVAVSYRAPDTFDIALEKRLIEEAVADRPDGLVVSLPDATLLGPPIESAIKAGIPVITINSGSDRFQSLGVPIHVGQPELEAGRTAGRRLVAAGVRQALCVDHEAGNEGLSDRCRGIADALHKAGGSSRVLDVDLQDPTGTQRAITQAIESDGADGVITMGAEAAGPALAALRTGGLEGSVKLATFDLSNEVLTAVSEKRMLFAVDQQPYLQGYLPIVLLAQRAKNGIFPTAGGLIPTGPRIVDASNVAQAIKENRAGVR